MWRWLSRDVDLIKLVRETDNLKELSSLKKLLLSDETGITNLRDSTVHLAIKEINSKIKNKGELIQDIFDLLF